MDLRVAATEYFNGERREMIVILLGAGLVIAAAAAVWLRARDGFAAGLGATAILAALLLGGTAAALLVRDGRSAPLIVESVATQPAAVAREGERIDKIIHNYPSYRYGALVLAVLAIGCLTFVARDWLNGVAVALLLVVAAQTVIDHYSETRARAYARHLA